MITTMKLKSLIYIQIGHVFAGEGKNCHAEEALLMMEILVIDLLRISI